MEVVPLSKRGKLISYTIIEIAAPEFKTPYAVGYVDLPEKVRLFSMLTDCEPFHEKLRVDMEMEMVIDEIKRAEDGTSILSYKFRPSSLSY
jgi:benzoylsuccinyl-CoA thiolase BbsA subunit